MLLNSLDSVCFITLSPIVLLDVKERAWVWRVNQHWFSYWLLLNFMPDTGLGTGNITVKWLTKQENILFNKNIT